MSCVDEEQAVFEHLTLNDFKMWSSIVFKTFNNYSIIMKNRISEVWLCCYFWVNATGCSGEFQFFLYHFLHRGLFSLKSHKAFRMAQCKQILNFDPCFRFNSSYSFTRGLKNWPKINFWSLWSNTLINTTIFFPSHFCLLFCCTMIKIQACWIADVSRFFNFLPRPHLSWGNSVNFKTNIKGGGGEVWGWNILVFWGGSWRGFTLFAGGQGTFETMYGGGCTSSSCHEE